MNKFKEKAKEAAQDAWIVDRWGASTGACPESFTQGAEWGYRQAISDSAQVTENQSNIYFDNMESSNEPYFSQRAFAAEGMRTVKK